MRKASYNTKKGAVTTDMIKSKWEIWIFLSSVFFKAEYKYFFTMSETWEDLEDLCLETKPTWMIQILILTGAPAFILVNRECQAILSNQIKESKSLNFRFQCRCLIFKQNLFVKHMPKRELRKWKGSYKQF